MKKHAPDELPTYEEAVTGRDWKRYSGSLLFAKFFTYYINTTCKLPYLRYNFISAILFQREPLRFLSYFCLRENSAATPGDLKRDIPTEIILSMQHLIVHG